MSIVTMRRYLATLAAALAAMSSASEVFWACTGWALQRYTTRPPATVPT